MVYSEKELLDLSKILVYRANIIPGEHWISYTTNPNSYHTFSYKGIQRKAAIWSAIVFLGLVLDENDNVPLGIEICHKCSLKGCWSPHHIYIGTKSSNRLDERYERLVNHLEMNHILHHRQDGKLSCKTCADNSKKKRIELIFRDHKAV